MLKTNKHLYEFGRFRLNEADRQLLRDGATVALTPKAFDLLLALVTQPGVLLDRDTLLQKVWPDAIVEEHNLTDNIAKLRKALSDGEDGQSYIQTVPKHGYRFVAAVRIIEPSPPSLPVPTPLVAATENPTNDPLPANVATVSAASPSAPKSFFSRRWLWLLAGGLAVMVLTWAYFRRAPAESRATYTYLPWPTKTAVSAHHGSPVLAPDGRRVAFTAVTEGTDHIWLYSLDAPEPVRLPGTEGARLPFWSPDGRQLGFFSSGRLKRIEASGGTPEIICAAPTGGGGTWGSAGVIVFASFETGKGLYQVSERGGTPTLVTSLDASRLETRHNFPRFLPDGRHFFFFAVTPQPENFGIKLGSLDQPQSSFLLRSDTNAEYSTAGYLLFTRGEKMLAQAFDAETRSLRGEPVTLVERANRSIANRYSPLTVCADKWLIYQGAGNPHTQLVWVDRSGKQLSPVGAPGYYLWLNLSPNGTQAVLERFEPQKVSSDLWAFDLLRETVDRLTSSESSNISPHWSPDAKHIAFTTNRQAVPAIWQKGVNGSDDKEELLFKEEAHPIFITDWSNDGKYIIYRNSGAKTATDLWLLPLSGDRQPQPYLTTPFEENWGKASPDGRWLVYQSNESGRNEIYVQSFPQPGQKVIVSKGGGTLPRWRRDGRELYYVAPDDKLMAVPVTTTGANLSIGLSFGMPVALFDVGSEGRRNNRYMYDVSADGQKILLLRPLEDATARPLTVVENWTRLLKQ